MSETFLHSRGTPRTVFLVLTSALTVAFTACLCFATLPDLYAMALLGGFAFGGHWAVIPAIISDLFGLRHYAKNYTCFQLAPAAGGYLLGTLLIGTLYERAAAAQDGEGGYCIGNDCYGMTWRVLTVLNLVSLAGSWLLMRRSRGAYEGM